eukprot:gene1387-32756_t
MFFGTLEIAWLAEGDVIGFKDGMDKGLLLKAKHKSFLKAVDEVCSFLRLDTKRRAPPSWWCKPPLPEPPPDPVDEANAARSARNEKRVSTPGKAKKPATRPGEAAAPPKKSGAGSSSTPPKGQHTGSAGVGKNQPSQAGGIQALAPVRTVPKLENKVQQSQKAAGGIHAPLGSKVQKAQKAEGGIHVALGSKIQKAQKIAGGIHALALVRTLTKVGSTDSVRELSPRCVSTEKRQQQQQRKAPAGAAAVKREGVAAGGVMKVVGSGRRPGPVAAAAAKREGAAADSGMKVVGSGQRPGPVAAAAAKREGAAADSAMEVVGTGRRPGPVAVAVAKREGAAVGSGMKIVGTGRRPGRPPLKAIAARKASGEVAPKAGAGKVRSGLSAHAVPCSAKRLRLAATGRKTVVPSRTRASGSIPIPATNDKLAEEKPAPELARLAGVSVSKAQPKPPPIASTSGSTVDKGATGTGTARATRSTPASVASPSSEARCQVPAAAGGLSKNQSKAMLASRLKHMACGPRGTRGGQGRGGRRVAGAPVARALRSGGGADAMSEGGHRSGGSGVEKKHSLEVRKLLASFPPLAALGAQSATEGPGVGRNLPLSTSRAGRRSDSKPPEEVEGPGVGGKLLLSASRAGRRCRLVEEPAEAAEEAAEGAGAAKEVGEEEEEEFLDDMSSSESEDAELHDPTVHVAGVSVEPRVGLVTRHTDKASVSRGSLPHTSKASAQRRRLSGSHLLPLKSGRRERGPLLSCLPAAKVIKKAGAQSRAEALHKKLLASSRGSKYKQEALTRTSRAPLASPSTPPALRPKAAAGETASASAALVGASASEPSGARTSSRELVARSQDGKPPRPGSPTPRQGGPPVGRRPKPALQQKVDSPRMMGLATDSRHRQPVGRSPNLAAANSNDGGGVEDHAGGCHLSDASGVASASEGGLGRRVRPRHTDSKQGGVCSKLGRCAMMQCAGGGQPEVSVKSEEHSRIAGSVMSTSPLPAGRVTCRLPRSSARADVDTLEVSVSHRVQESKEPARAEADTLEVSVSHRVQDSEEPARAEADILEVSVSHRGQEHGEPAGADADTLAVSVSHRVKESEEPATAVETSLAARRGPNGAVDGEEEQRVAPMEGSQSGRRPEMLQASSCEPGGWVDPQRGGKSCGQQDSEDKGRHCRETGELHSHLGISKRNLRAAPKPAMRYCEHSMDRAGDRRSEPVVNGVALPHPKPTQSAARAGVRPSTAVTTATLSATTGAGSASAAAKNGAKRTPPAHGGLAHSKVDSPTRPKLAGHVDVKAEKGELVHQPNTDDVRSSSPGSNALECPAQHADPVPRGPHIIRGMAFVEAIMYPKRPGVQVVDASEWQPLPRSGCGVYDSPSEVEAGQSSGQVGAKQQRVSPGIDSEEEGEGQRRIRRCQAVPKRSVPLASQDRLSYRSARPGAASRLGVASGAELRAECLEGGADLGRPSRQFGRKSNNGLGSEAHRGGSDGSGPERMTKRNVWVSCPRPKRLPKATIVPLVGEEDGFVISACAAGCSNRLAFLHCDSSSCPCGELCSNRAFHQLEAPSLEVFPTSNRGYGVKTRQAVARGGFVVEYAGEVIDHTEMKRRTNEPRAPRESHAYAVELEAGLLLDARCKGSVARLVNNSCDPNCELQKWRDAATGEPGVALFAKRDIAPEEELSLNYFSDHFMFNSTAAAAFTCLCGAKGCRGSFETGSEKRNDLGRKLEVYWDDDGSYYKGIIVGYLATSGRHIILYEDGQKERVQLDE